MFCTAAALVSIAVSGMGAAPGTASRCAESIAHSSARITANVPASDYAYTFVVTEENSKSPTKGTVRVHGDRTRIDIDKANGSGEYILLTDGGTRMLSVHPNRREIDQISAPTFERVIGTSLRMVSPMVKFKVLNSKMSWERVGTGQKLLGYATEQIRMTERFDVKIRAMGFDGGTEHNTIVTDFWVSPGLDLGSNPLLVLIEHASNAMAQTDADFVNEEASVRARALQGTPLRTVVTETTVNDKGVQHVKTHSIDITSVRMSAQPAALFDVPSGYRIKSGADFSM
jgi:hypothetical protein